MAAANAQIEADYLNNLLNYNEQQRQYIQNLQNQANYQYADNYQAQIDNLLAQGYSPNSMEVLQLQALRGNKVANNNAMAQQNALASIKAGNINYNNAAALGWTVEQAQSYYNNLVAQVQAQAQAEAEQQAFENYIKQVQLNNATALNNSNIAKNNATIANINDQINKRGTSDGNNSAYTQNVKDIENKIDNMPFKNDDEIRNYIDSFAGILTQDEYTRLYLDYQL